MKKKKKKLRRHVEERPVMAMAWRVPLAHDVDSAILEIGVATTKKERKKKMRSGRRRDDRSPATLSIA